MDLERKKDLSLYYYIKEMFSDTSFITIVDGYPEELLTLPTIAIEADTLRSLSFELGNRHGSPRRIWFIDVFGNTKSQRDEIGYKIVYDLEEGIPVYNYDEGFPPTVTPTQIGMLVPYDYIEMKIVKVLPELVSKLYWRATISFVADYTNI